MRVSNQASIGYKIHCQSFITPSWRLCEMNTEMNIEVNTEVNEYWRHEDAKLAGGIP